MSSIEHAPSFVTDSDLLAEALGRELAARDAGARRPPVSLVARTERAAAIANPPGSGGGAIQVISSTSDWFDATSPHRAVYVVDPTDLRSSLARLLDLVSVSRRVTPDRTEFGMHAAYGAALRSAALRGGVGAALVDAHGDVVALGTAEVPAYGGGQYWEGPGDARDFVRGGDPATTARAATVERLLELLAERGVTMPAGTPAVACELLAEFDRRQGSHGVGHGAAEAQTFESLGRVVHAEMAALLNAARNGIRTTSRTLYVTAPPCRHCLRHLVCAGVERVVYFGRRLAAAPAFHADSVGVDAGTAHRLQLVPFTGVGPGGYQRLFTTQMTVWNNKLAFATGG